MIIKFIGDIMLGRFIGEKYNKQRYLPVAENLISHIREADYVIANLESPISLMQEVTSADHLSFLALPDILHKFKWVNCFSTANNHINDGGEAGIKATVQALQYYDIAHTGVFKEDYSPYCIEVDSNRIAIITLTDMLNIPFEDGESWNVLRMGDNRVIDCIKQYKMLGYLVIVYAHVGMLFTRFPNPITYGYLHQYIDDGCDAVVTAHSHCVGGLELYKGKPLFHSLGDFVMDGSSFRRRRSSILTFKIENNTIIDYKVNFAYTDWDLQTKLATGKIASRMAKSVANVGYKIAKNRDNYTKFYKWQYRKEIIQHILSTIHFLLKERGFRGFIRILWIRANETKRMAKWVTMDRSNLQYDGDALNDRIDVSKIKKNERP